MLKKGKVKNEIDPPPIAFEDPKSVEVMRVWASPLVGQQFVINPIWKDPGAFGLLLADVVNHAANAYASRDGIDRKEAIDRIMELFIAEMKNPTDPYKEMKGH
jgi:hypothetical protein